MRFFAFLILFSLSMNASASNFTTPEEAGLQIRQEFDGLYQYVQNLEPEYEVGGMLKAKEYGDHKLLWDLADEPGETDVIRIYRSKGRGDFNVTYHRTHQIIEGKIVIRRFVGPLISGWRNDTIDAHTNEYLGAQGVFAPDLDQRDTEIMEKWGVRLLP